MGDDPIPNGNQDGGSDGALTNEQVQKGCSTSTNVNSNCSGGVSTSSKRALEENVKDEKGDENDNGNANTNGEDLPPSKKARVEEEPTTATLSETETKKSTDATNTETSPAPAKSIFGSTTTSGFSGFGGGTSSTNSIFGSTSSAASESKPTTSFFGSASSSTSTRTTSIFGSASSSTGFGANSSSSAGFGSSTNASSGSIFGSASTTAGKSMFSLGSGGDGNKGADGSPSKSSSWAPVVSLPEADGPVKNGEENEETIITLRAKLYKLTKVVAAEEKKEETKTVGIQMATKVGQTVKDNNSESGSADQQSSKKAESSWREVGIGPLRVLTDTNTSHTRVVQRRENTPGGQGTKLILNVSLKDECSVQKMGDKILRLAAFEVIEDSEDDKGASGTNGKIENERDDDDGDAGKKQESQDENPGGGVKFAPVQYLFKVKTVEEANSLLATLEKFCGKR